MGSDVKVSEEQVARFVEGLIFEHNQLPGFVRHLETKYGKGIARVFVRTRLRSRKYLMEGGKTWLEEKLAELEDNS